MKCLDAKIVKIKKTRPNHELSDRALVAKLKYLFPKFSAGELYSQFVKARDLGPEIDMKGFKQLFDATHPIRPICCKEVPFEATHRSRQAHTLICMKLEPNRPGGPIPLILRWGNGDYGEGSEPSSVLFDERWERIDDE